MSAALINTSTKIRNGVYCCVIHGIYCLSYVQSELPQVFCTSGLQLYYKRDRWYPDTGVLIDAGMPLCHYVDAGVYKWPFHLNSRHSCVPWVNICPENAEQVFYPLMIFLAVLAAKVYY